MPKKESGGVKDTLSSYVSIFKDVTSFIKDNFQPVINTLLVISVGIFMYTGFQIMQAEIDNLRQVTNNVTQLQPETLNETFKTNTSINKVLDKILDETGAARAYVFKYHDGVKPVQGVEFVFASNTHEATRKGVNSEINNNQRIPLSFIQEQSEALINYEIFCKNTKTEILDSGFSSFLMAQNIQAVCTVPLYLNDVFIGFIGVDYVNKEITEQEKRSLQTTLSSSSKIIEGILSAETENAQ